MSDTDRSAKSPSPPAAAATDMAPPLLQPGGQPLLHSPAAERNRAPILAQLQRLLPARGRLLEIASGTGQHAAHCAPALPGWAWQPSDPDRPSLASIPAWAAASGAAGVLAPIQLDVLAQPWPVQGTFDAVFNANMLHIAPWACCAALMQGAARVLAPEGQLITYGPYQVLGEPLSPGNRSFDASLRERDPAWGLRWLHEVQAEAEQAGLGLVERAAMPANNLLLVFRRRAPG